MTSSMGGLKQQCITDVFSCYMLSYNYCIYTVQFQSVFLISVLFVHCCKECCDVLM